MPICVVVLAESVTANQFSEKLREAGSPLIKTQLIQPLSKGLGPNSIPPQGISEDPMKTTQALKPIDFDKECSDTE